MWKFLTKLKCKMMVCCNSNCSFNDTDNDGIVDSITIQKENYDKEINIK